MSYNETTKFCTSDDVLANDWYNILGCSMRSSQTEIDDAYRKLAKQYHPDKNSEASSIKQFYLINSAYQILGDREIRAFYDYESGNINSFSEYRFKSEKDVDEYKVYIDQLTGYKISANAFEDNIWEEIDKNLIPDRTIFKRNLNIFGTLDVSKWSLEQGIRTAFPVFRYKTCGVCRGFGKIGVTERDVCYNCGGFGIENERIFVYVEIPPKYKCDKLFKVPGRGHKTPIAIGDLIIKINPVSKLGMRTRVLHSSFKNRGMKGGW